MQILKKEHQLTLSSGWINVTLIEFDFPLDGDSFQYILEMNSKILAKKSGFVIQIEKARLLSVFPEV